MESIEPGAYYDITNEQYHTGPGVSSSGIKKLLDCPSKYKHEYLDGNRKEPTRELILGTAFHTKLLEPGLFHKELENKVVRDNVDMLNGMYDSVMMDPVIGKIFQTDNGAAELSIFDTDKTTGEMVKTRPDWYRPDAPRMVFDLKTARDASHNGFQGAIGRFGYHISAAMCLEIMKRHFPELKYYVFIVVEKTPPYPVAQYVLDDRSLQVGEYEYRQGLDILAECRRSGFYPHYNQGHTKEIGLAGWYLKKLTADFNTF